MGATCSSSVNHDVDEISEMAMELEAVRKANIDRAKLFQRQFELLTKTQSRVKDLEREVHTYTEENDAYAQCFMQIDSALTTVAQGVGTDFLSDHSLKLTESELPH